MWLEGQLLIHEKAGLKRTGSDGDMLLARYENGCPKRQLFSSKEEG
jgi:hypothetical protein